MGVQCQGAKPGWRGVAEAGTRNTFPCENKLLRGCEGVTLRSSSCEIAYRKMEKCGGFCTENAWQHCFDLSLHVGTITPVGWFGDRQTLPLCSSQNSTASFITPQRPRLFYFTNESCFHQGKFNGPAGPGSHRAFWFPATLSAARAFRRWRRWSRALQCRSLGQEDADVQGISGPLGPPTLPV